MQLNSLWLYCFRLKTITGTLDESHDSNAESDRISNIYCLWMFQLITLFFSVVCSNFNKIFYDYIDHKFTLNTPHTNTSNFFDFFDWLAEFRKLHLNNNHSYKPWFSTWIGKPYFVIRYLLRFLTQLCILAFVNYFQLGIINEHFNENNNKLESNVYVSIALFASYTLFCSYMAVVSLLCISKSTFAFTISFSMYHFCCYFTLTCVLMTVTPSKLFLYSAIIAFKLFALAILGSLFTKKS